MKTLLGRALSGQRRLHEAFFKMATYPRLYDWMRRNEGLDTIYGEDRQKRYLLFDYVSRTTSLTSEPILYAEFGVHEGASIRWWVNANDHPQSRFYGFDSFEGLPEDWIPGAPAGAFNTGGRIPAIDDPRVRFVKGWFHSTLPSQLDTFASAHRRVVHLDADLYRSAIYPLLLIGPHLKPNDILIFDEFDVSTDEFRAFGDFQQIFGIDADVVQAMRGFTQTAFCLRHYTLTPVIPNHPDSAV